VRGTWTATHRLLLLAEGVLRAWASPFQAKERPIRQVEEKQKQKRIEYLEKKVQTKDEVLAELMAEHVALKKSLGEL
jgi:hypothetical protein